MVRLRSRFATAAFVGILLATLPQARVAAQQFDPAEAMPQDTLAYIGWSKAWSGFGLSEFSPDGIADLFLGFSRMDSPPDSDVEGFAKALRLLLVAAEGTGGMALYRLDPEAEPPLLELGGVLDVGDKLKAFAFEFDAMVREGGDTESIKPATIGDATLSSFQPDDDAPTFYWGTYKQKFILAAGEGGVRKLIDGLAGKGTKLSANGEFAACRKKIPVGKSPSTLIAFCDTAALLSKALRPIIQQESGMPSEELDKLLKALGVSGLKSALLDCDTSEYGPRARLFIRIEGPYTGVLKLWDQKPLSEEDLKLLPRDAYVGGVWNLDLQALWEESLRIAAEIAPGSEDQIAGFDAIARNAIGFSLTQDMLPAFGDTWAFFDSPRQANYLLSGIVLVAEARQPADLSEMMKEVARRAAPFAEAGEVALHLKEMKQDGRTINYVMIGGVPSPVAPAWAVIGDRVVFALFPQSIAAVADQIDPATRKTSILEHPDLKAAFAELPKKQITFGYVASRELIRSAYPFYLIGGTMLFSLGGTDGSADLSKLRTLEKFREPVRDAVGCTSVEADGVLYTSVGNNTIGSASVGSVAMVTAILLPSLSRAREQARRVASAANLKGIGMAIHMYAADHKDDIPESLDALVAADMITQEMLVSPRDDSGQRYVLAASGKLSELRMNDVLAYEPMVGTEGTNVLFVDGHVEWVKPPRLQELIQPK